MLSYQRGQRYGLIQENLQVADQNGDGILQWNELIIANDIVVMATPEIANLGVFVIGLVAAGAMAAALSTAGGLMISLSSSFAHDIYYRVLRPNASEKNRLLVGTNFNCCCNTFSWIIALTLQEQLRKLLHGHLRLLQVPSSLH